MCHWCEAPAVALQDTFRSFYPEERTSTVLEVEFHPEMSPRPGPLEQGALESPKKLEELDRQEEVKLQTRRATISPCRKSAA